MGRKQDCPEREAKGAAVTTKASDDVMGNS